MPTPYRKLQDKHILAIGGSSGLGRATAEAALAAGARITIASSSAAKVDKHVATLRADYPGSHVHGVVVDLSKENIEAELEALFQAAEAVNGPVNHVVQTAAPALTLTPLDDINVANISQLLHMRGTVQLLIGKVAARHIAPHHDNSIVFSSGTIAVKPAKGWSTLAYTAGGIISMTKALAVELAPVRVNVVQPGFVDTELWDPFGTEAAAKVREASIAETLTKRAAGPEDVAEAYLWLLKDGNVTGTTASSDGGLFLV